MRRLFLTCHTFAYAKLELTQYPTSSQENTVCHNYPACTDRNFLPHNLAEVCEPKSVTCHKDYELATITYPSFCRVRLLMIRRLCILDRYYLVFNSTEAV